MQEFVILISYPLAWCINRTGIFDGIPNKALTKTLVSFLIVELLILLSPFSFTGRTIDYSVLLCTILLAFLLGLRLNKSNHLAGKILVGIGKMSVVSFFILVLLIISNPLYYAYQFDVSRFKPTSIIELDGYRLEHFSMSSNFTYAGTHIIVVQKTLIPHFLEIKEGQVDVGQYNTFDVPEYNKSTVTFYYDNNPSTPKELSQTIYEIDKNYLIKKARTDSTYVETARFNIQ